MLQCAVTGMTTVLNTCPALHVYCMSELLSADTESGVAFTITGTGGHLFAGMDKNNFAVNKLDISDIYIFSLS